MNIFSVNKALIDHLEDFLLTTGGLPPLFKSGGKEEPSADSEHITEYVLDNGSKPIGISHSDSEILRGIYQVDINVPKRQGRFGLLEIADKVSLGFPRGLTLTHGGQEVKVVSTSCSPVRGNDLSNLVSLRIRFTVIG